MAPAYRVAADVGGTFTDIVLLASDGCFATRKVPSTPQNYADAVVSGIRAALADLGAEPSSASEILHACTVATNAVLQQSGARTAFVTTEGFRDLLELRRARVPQLYEPLYLKPPPIVPRQLCFELRERLDASGRVQIPLDEGELGVLAEELKAAGVEAVAVCLLHAPVNPEHEQRAGAYLRGALPECFVTLSSEVLPEIKEYERASTTVINAYVGPPVRHYLGALVAQIGAADLAAPLRIMQSSGAILDPAAVLARPAQIVECGPAAGVTGAAHIGRLSGYPNLISFDMGGTTAKASIVEDGKWVVADELEVGGGISLSSRLVKGAGYPLRLPAIDISEVGAGGGSIVWLDRAGAIKIGPQSAGAVPGPACYGAGNDRPTVTDANVVLGFLNQHALAGGSVPIDAALSRRAIETHVAGPLGLPVLEAAYGIHSVANANMMRAVKSITTYRGRDPRDFTMMAFGGNGGIHGVELARALRVRKLLVPPAAGVFSALGLLFADVALTLARPCAGILKAVKLARLEEQFAALERAVAAEMGRAFSTLAFERFLDLRYAGQAFELTVPLSKGPIRDGTLQDAEDAFEMAHERTYGHRMVGGYACELVNLRVTGRLPSDPANLQFQGRRMGLGHRSGREGNRPLYFGPRFGLHETPVLSRASLQEEGRPGPLVIDEYEGTTVVPPGCEARLDGLGNIVIDIGELL